MTTPPIFSGSPIATTMSEMASPAQHGLLSRISRYDGVDVTGECLALLGCKPEDLSRDAARAFISYLKSDSFQSAVKREVA